MGDPHKWQLEDQNPWKVLQLLLQENSHSQQREYPEELITKNSEEKRKDQVKGEAGYEASGLKQWL